MSRKETSLSILSIMVIVAASLGIVTLGEVAMPKMAHGQVDITSLTPEQKAAICDPSDTHINATESKICGKPVTPSSNSTSSGNPAAGAEVPTSNEGQ